MARRDDVERGQRNAARLINDPRFKDLMIELADNPALLQEAKANPKDFFRNRNVELPGNPTRVVIEEGSIRIGLCWGDWCIWFEF